MFMSEPQLFETSKRTSREAFLKFLAGKKNKYKRYTGLPLRYAGGKSLAVGHVIEKIPDGISEIASPFFGGGAIEIACSKELGMKVHGYDIFDVLANYWQVQISNPEKLADTVRKLEPTKEEYRQVKERLKRHWNRSEAIDDPILLAAYYWFNHNLSYGPGFLGWMSKLYEDESRYARMTEKIASFSPGDISVEAASFEESLQSHRDVFLYCDPPYYLDGDSRMFKGIYPQRNFPVHHIGFDHLLLREMLAEHQNGFVLSYNDCSYIRNLYSDCEISEVKWQYTLGQGETRIGENRLNSKANHVKQSHEILICSR